MAIEAVVGSTLKIATTGGTLAEVVGAQSIKATDGGSSTFESAGITAAINSRTPTGVVEAGSGSFSFYENPTDTVHKLIQSSINTGARMDFEITGASGKKRTGTGILKSSSTDWEKKGGVKVDVEIELESIWTITEAV